jgi:hypothetical protein
MHYTIRKKTNAALESFELPDGIYYFKEQLNNADIGV